MINILYYILYGAIWLISLLPFCVMYLLSDILSWLMWHIFKYRKKIVVDNIAHAFPDKSTEEINIIAKRFYTHLCDIIVEGIKFTSMSERSIRKHLVVENMDSVVNKVYKDNRHLVLMMGHYGNWEWLCALPLFGMKLHPLSAYKTMENGVFDRIFYHIRSRFGTELVFKRAVLRNVVDKVNNNQYTLINLIADQNPSGSSIHLWLPFMGREVPVFVGGEVIARKFDMVVGYLTMRRIKRGCYRVNMEILCDSPNILPQHEIMAMFIRRLEEDIRICPELWLWSHRRWRHHKGEKN